MSGGISQEKFIQATIEVWESLASENHKILVEEFSMLVERNHEYLENIGISSEMIGAFQEGFREGGDIGSYRPAIELVLKAIAPHVEELSEELGVSEGEFHALMDVFRSRTYRAWNEVLIRAAIRAAEGFVLNLLGKSPADEDTFKLLREQLQNLDVFKS